MPFDGEALERPAVAALDRVLRLIGRESQWCKGALEKDGRRCLVGALRMAAAEKMLEPILLCAIREVSGRSYWRLEHFNDHAATRHEDVLGALRLARRWLESGYA
jgi:hypothetical protein